MIRKQEFKLIERREKKLTRDKLHEKKIGRSCEFQK